MSTSIFSIFLTFAKYIFSEQERMPPGAMCACDLASFGTMSCREDGNFLNHAKNINVLFVAKSNFISLSNFVFDDIKTRPTWPLGEMRHD